MIRIAVVGKIGSGKSFVAKLFKLPLFNADKEVSKIYNIKLVVIKTFKVDLTKLDLIKNGNLKIVIVLKNL